MKCCQCGEETDLIPHDCDPGEVEKYPDCDIILCDRCWHEMCAKCGNTTRETHAKVTLVSKVDEARR